MKTCTVCRKKKKLIEFHKDKSTKDGRTFQCALCARAATERWKRSGSVATQKKRMKKKKMSQTLAKERNHSFILDYLQAHHCVDCGESDPICLDFDHVRGNKTMNICYMMNCSYSIVKLELEISKCDVRCSNCHRKRTASVQGWYKLLHQKGNHPKSSRSG